MEDRNTQRMRDAMDVYETVRIVLEQLREVDLALDDSDLDDYGATTRAQKHVERARQELDELAVLLRQLHMRPTEDASDDAFLN